MSFKHTSVCVIGLKKRGLNYVAALTAAGHTVSGYDADATIISALNRAHYPSMEPAQQAHMTKARAAEKLAFFNAPHHGEVYLIAFEDEVPFTEHILKETAQVIAPLLDAGDLIILTQTVPVGATEKALIKPLLAARPELAEQLFFAYVPETVADIVTGKRERVIGGHHQAAAERAAAFYATFSKDDAQLTTLEQAEFTHLVQHAWQEVQHAYCLDVLHRAEASHLSALHALSALGLEKMLHEQLNPQVAGMASQLLIQTEKGGKTLLKEVASLCQQKAELDV